MAYKARGMNKLHMGPPVPDPADSLTQPRSRGWGLVPCAPTTLIPVPSVFGQEERGGDVEVEGLGVEVKVEVEVDVKLAGD